MANGKLIPDLILAAGGIVIRGNQTIVVCHERRREWTLPRGKLKRGESPLAAAIRETRGGNGVLGASRQVRRLRLVRGEWNSQGGSVLGDESLR